MVMQCTYPCYQPSHFTWIWVDRRRGRVDDVEMDAVRCSFLILISKSRVWDLHLKFIRLVYEYGQTQHMDDMHIQIPLLIFQKLFSFQDRVQRY